MTLKYSNIFDLVTEDKAVAKQYQMRSDLMIAIRDLIQYEGWSQAIAAKKLGLTQPRISDLVNGKIEKFSIDKLLACCENVNFHFKPSFAEGELKIDVVREELAEA